MNDIKIFEHNEFGSIRTLEIDGVPHWVAIDVTRILGYSRNSNAVTQHCEHALKQGVLTRTGMKPTYVIPESDLYRLIVHSRLPSAKAFEKWVFETVLPQIRATGEYKPKAKETALVPIKTAEFTELQKEVREIKRILESGTQKRHAKRPGNNLARDYINVMLETFARQSGTASSTILHEGYLYLTEGGMNPAYLKMQYLQKDGLNDCATLDAVIDNRNACKEFIYFLQCNIYDQL